MGKVPASTLCKLAGAFQSSAGDGGTKIPSSGAASAGRDARAFIKKSGLTFDVPFSYYQHFHDGEVLEIPYLSPLKFVPYLLEQSPELLFGGLSARGGQKMLSGFWSAYKQSHSQHKVFQDHADNLSTVLPLCLHGDEGRGVRKGNTCIVSIESPFGMATAENVRAGRHYHACQCCSGSAVHLAAGVESSAPPDAPSVSYQALNTKGHCYLNRFVIFALPSALSKDSELIDALLHRVAMELKQIYWEGVKAHDRWWSCALIGCKGDLAWFWKLGSLTRSYRNLSDDGNLMCHECLAGSNTCPFEDLREVPLWSKTLYAQRPWDVNSPPSIASVPFDRECPERVLQRDLFHLTKVGVYRDFIGSSVLLLCHLKYFDQEPSPGISNARPVLLGRARNHFRLFCLASKKSAALRTFTKDNFNAPSRKSFPWISCKGSDTVLLIDWICVLTRACINTRLDDKHLQVLELINKTARAANDWLRALYMHGIWLPKQCAFAMYKTGRCFIENYNLLAFKCLHELEFSGYKMKPKIHLIAHTLLEQISWVQDPRVTLIPSPFLWNCEGGEDLIGRVSRISRRCHQATVCASTLEKYLTKTKFLYDHWKASPAVKFQKSLKRKAEHREQQPRRVAKSSSCPVVRGSKLPSFVLVEGCCLSLLSGDAG